VADLQTVVLLTSLAEQHGNTLGPTATIALRHAARRLWELWNEDGAGGDGPLELVERFTLITDRVEGVIEITAKGYPRSIFGCNFILQ